MDKQLKARWTKALRSGEYEQTRHVLRSVDGGYCCLGVLCSTLDAEWIAGRPLLKGTALDDDDEFLLSKGTLKRVGISKGDQHILSEMNDKGKSFSEIADYIEQKL